MIQMNVLRATFTRVLCVLLVSAFVFIYSTKVSAQIPTINKEVADFTLPTLDGKEITLSSFRGKSNVILSTFRGWVGYW